MNKNVVSIIKLLSDLGYDVDVNEEDDQQFSCDLHGGADSKPSARAYPSSNSWYCFACKKSRDIFSTVMEIYSLDFKGSVDFLKEKYNLTSKDFSPTEGTIPVDDGLELLGAFEGFLSLLTRGRKIEKEKCIKMWDIFDKLYVTYKTKNISKRELEDVLLRLKAKAF